MYDNIGGEMKILSDCTAKNAACIFRYAEKRMARTAELAHIVCRKILSGSNADIMDVICTSDEAREEYGLQRKNIFPERKRLNVML